jgi:Bacterial membrane protein YfhO
VVEQAVVESADEVRRRVNSESLDLLHTAYLSEPLGTPLDPEATAPAEVTFDSYQADRFELDANVSATGLLVLSEIYYPGWSATINGQPAHIYKVDNILRGLIVSPGSNHIVMEYRPRSLRLGVALSLLAFLGTFLFAALVFWRDRRHSP